MAARVCKELTFLLITTKETKETKNTKAKKAGLNYWVEAGYEAQLLGPEAPNWADLSGDGRAELIKANRRRKVWQVQLDKLHVFVKRYERGGPLSLLKCLFRSGPASVEFENHRRVRTAGLKCPEPLAFAQKGFRGMGGPGILITTAVKPAEPLNAYLRKHTLDDELVTLLAEFPGRGHRAGLAHPDPHLGNFLIRVDSQNQRELILTDLQKLHTIRFPTETLTRAAKRNLACCYVVVRHHMSSQQQKKFLADYLGTLFTEHAPTEAGVRKLHRQIERLAKRRSLRKWAKRDRRHRRNSKYFARIRLSGHWKGSVLLKRKEPLPGSKASALNFTADQWRKTLTDPLNLFAESKAQTVRDSQSSLIVRRELKVGQASLQVYCRLLRPQSKVISQFKTLWAAFRTSRPQRAYETGFALLNRRIPTVLPLAWLAKQIGPYRSLAILITEAMADTENLEQFFKANCVPGEGFQNHSQLNDLAKMTAELAGSLIRHGFVHRYFQPRNILLKCSADGKKRLFLTDCESIRKVCSITARQRLCIPMRMQLATVDWPSLSRTTRLRFLLTYLQAIQMPANQWKWYWQKADTWAKRKKAGRASRAFAHN